MFPKPSFLGVFTFFIAILCFIIGHFRHEIGLVFIACVFLVVLVYCFIAILIIGIVFRNEMKTSFHVVLSEKVNTGGQVRVSVAHCPHFLKFLKIPGILVRCETKLLTADKRLIRFIFDPLRPEGFIAKERGAYYRDSEAFIFSDAMGFFLLKNALSILPVPPLLVLPNPAKESGSPPVQGGDMRSIGACVLKGENLVDHRPYVPGDDPRRINWKLFSHARELFVREEERTPPFHSSVLLFLDTRTDEPYTDSARQAVDELCEKAFSLACEWTAQGIDVHIGFTGEKGLQEDADFAETLAFPASCTASESFPAFDDKRGIVILTVSAVDNALTRR
ncbi:MAG: DUF58 domain-containing protein [Treponema sp.]|jgi:uncharacterized protein (DUF58 family)|nr:DUF58 domain-containing protein [Treponema sp.]